MIYSTRISERTFRLILLTLFALLLLAGRLVLDQQSMAYARPARLIIRPPVLFFLGWNLWLAWIPYLLALALQKRPTPGAVALLLLFIWLLFFPNAPYLATDLIHLRMRRPVPLWYDLILLLTFAWLGLLLGFASLGIVEKWLSKQLPPPWSRLTIPVFLALGSFGVYLGRVLRWNSWDLFFAPGPLFASILDLFTQPAAHRQAWGMTGLMFLFLLLIYYCMPAFIPRKESAEVRRHQKYGQ